MMDDSMIDHLRGAAQRLAASGISSPALDARLLMQHAIGCDRSAIVRDGARPLSADESRHFRSLVDRRLAREPLSHIVGTREFWRDRFEVSAHVLDPRPDSEALIEAVLQAKPDRDAPLRVLDLGTGSGCLLLSVLREYPHATGTGVDLSPHAAQVAQRNAVCLGLSERASFVVARWTEALQSDFDVVMSNPPYIAAHEIATLEPEVRCHEPHLALSGGHDGLEAYRSLMPAIASHLKSSGVAVVEIGIHQGPDVSALAQRAGLEVTATRADLAGVHRALVIEHAKGLRSAADDA